MFRTDVWALPPGITAAVETYEAAFRWGPAGLGLITSGYIDAAATDPGNGATTFELRPGLLMGQKTATGTWSNYNPANSDGSEVAAGVNITSIRMTDILTQQGQARFYGILVGGPVQAAKLIGPSGAIDLYARQCMSDHFWFDDAGNFPGNHWFPFRRFQNKTANYQVTAGDNFSVFTNTGASGEVDLTLPPIAAGYYFALKDNVAQIFKFISSEGGNIVGDTASRSQISVTAIGGGIEIFSNAAGTLWYASNISSGAQVVSYA
jgi:hypothetical protein